MTRPDFDKLADEVIIFLNATYLHESRRREWLSAKIGQVYHQGAIDALDSASVAVNEALAKQGGKA